MNKLTWYELKHIIEKHNKHNNVKQQYSDKNFLSCVVVISNSSFGDKEYPLEARSYQFRSDEKYFLPDMLGSSIFADSLDGTDRGVRLDWYIFKEWEIEYCYIMGIYGYLPFDESVTYGELVWESPRTSVIWAIHPVINYHIFTENMFVFVVDSLTHTYLDGHTSTRKYNLYEITRNDILNYELKWLEYDISDDDFSSKQTYSRFWWRNQDYEFVKIRIDKTNETAVEIAKLFERAKYPVEYYDGGDDNVNNN